MDFEPALFYQLLLKNSRHIKETPRKPPIKAPIIIPANINNLLNIF